MFRLEAEKIKAMPGDLATKIRDLSRGYSDAEVQQARRILTGNISTDDRLRYKSDESNTLSLVLIGDLRTPASMTGDLTIAPALPVFLEQNRELQRLPDDLLDQRLRQKAREKLESWHQFHHASPSQRLWDNKVFRFLSNIRLDQTVYPFTLKGEDYLSSGWKRGLDVSVGLFGLLVSALPIAAAAIAIKINVPEKSPFITRYRHGLNNNQFNMYKIRSQRTDTSTDGTINTVAVGRLLRATSIDELPQFWHVLSGDMSAVGRRPTLPIDYQKIETRFLGEIPYQKAKRYLKFTDEQWNSNLLDEQSRARVVSLADWVRTVSKPKYEKYVSNNRAKPGLTGLYQVLGRKDIALEDRVALELAYERRLASLGLDMAILAATVWAVLQRKGAR